MINVVFREELFTFAASFFVHDCGMEGVPGENTTYSAFKIDMMKNVKINTALLVGLAFIFRIVFFNIFVVPSSNTHTHETSGLIKSHFSTAMKRRVNFEVADNAENSEYSFAELLEDEGLKAHNQFESNPFFLVHFLYSLIANEITIKLKDIVPFYNYLSYASSHRYLALQVFRT